MKGKIEFHSTKNTLRSLKGAYPHRVSSIKLEETHISWVILTGLYAYKIKKALKFGKILDFCTLTQRRKNCEKELALNKILCDDIYMKVVKVIKEENSNRVKIADLKDTRKAIEYAVQMRQMPYYLRMDKLLNAGKISTKIIRNLTEVLVKFHYTTPTSDRIRNFGQPKFMRKKIREFPDSWKADSD